MCVFFFSAYSNIVSFFQDEEWIERVEIAREGNCGARTGVGRREEEEEV